jgi:hypothetical protein
MQVEILNNFLGDNLVSFDTDTDEGKQKVVELFHNLLRAGTAIFLERAEQTYRVTGFDPITDSLKVEVLIPQPKEGGRPCECKKCAGCANSIADRSRTGICSACQQGKHGGKKLIVAAKPRRERGDRVTAVGPRAGG